MHTVLNLILCMEKNNNFNFEKCALSGKGRQSLHIVHIMRIRKKLISYVRLDHTLYSINYGNYLVSVC